MFIVACIILYITPIIHIQCTYTHVHAYIYYTNVLSGSLSLAEPEDRKELLLLLLDHNLYVTEIQFAVHFGTLYCM